MYAAAGSLTITLPPPIPFHPGAGHSLRLRAGLPEVLAPALRRNRPHRRHRALLHGWAGTQLNRFVISNGFVPTSTHVVSRTAGPTFHPTTGSLHERTSSCADLKKTMVLIAAIPLQGSMHTINGRLPYC